MINKLKVIYSPYLCVALDGNINRRLESHYMIPLLKIKLEVIAYSSGVVSLGTM